MEITWGFKKCGGGDKTDRFVLYAEGFACLPLKRRCLNPCVYNVYEALLGLQPFILRGWCL